jgi:hypothetical protein
MPAFSGPSVPARTPIRLPLAGQGQRAPSLSGEVREVDRVRPIYAVWEITLRCDLGCQTAAPVRATRARMS